MKNYATRSGINQKVLKFWNTFKNPYWVKLQTKKYYPLVSTLLYLNPRSRSKWMTRYSASLYKLLKCALVSSLKTTSMEGQSHTKQAQLVLTIKKSYQQLFIFGF